MASGKGASLLQHHWELQHGQRWTRAPRQHHRQQQHGQWSIGAREQHHCQQQHGQRGIKHFIVTPPAIETMPSASVLWRRTPSAEITPPSVLKPSFLRPSAGATPPSGILRFTTTPLRTTTQPLVLLRSPATPSGMKTRRSVILRSLTTRLATTISLWAVSPAEVPWAISTSTLAIRALRASPEPCGLAQEMAAIQECFSPACTRVTTGQANAVPVLIDALGQLGPTSSSRRFKTDIKPIDKASESIVALKPEVFVTGFKRDHAAVWLNR